MFATPQSVDVGEVARAHGIDTELVDLATFPKLVSETPERARALIINVDRTAARAQHDRLWSAVASALGGASA
jgi:2-succinyl-5-enolpyruvyl-6-hydroxy-3-cyclohexene-1-carboxylate synthase